MFSHSTSTNIFRNGKRCPGFITLLQRKASYKTDNGNEQYGKKIPHVFNLCYSEVFDLQIKTNYWNYERAKL